MRFILIVLLALPLAAQTRINLDQIKVYGEAPFIYVCLALGPDEDISTKQLIPVTLDSETLELIKGADGNYTLRAKVAFAIPIMTTYKLDAKRVDFSVGGTLGLEVYRNGLIQTEGEDYGLNGTIVTFLPRAVPQPNDIVKFKHYER